MLNFCAPHHSTQIWPRTIKILLTAFIMVYSVFGVWRLSRLCEGKIAGTPNRKNNVWHLAFVPTVRFSLRCWFQMRNCVELISRSNSIIYQKNCKYKWSCSLIFSLRASRACTCNSNRDFITALDRTSFLFLVLHVPGVAIAKIVKTNRIFRDHHWWNAPLLGNGLSLGGLGGNF